MTGSTSLSTRAPSSTFLNRLSVGRQLLGGLVLGGLVLSLAGVALLPVQPASAAANDSACAGVTVVVDFTDVDGGVKTGCAVSGFDTGLDALRAAGFTSTESQPGLVCAIEAKPNPCPTTFEGSFWSYWHGTSSDAEWTTYQVGAATSHPVAGSVEGWRYNDGTTGPGLTPHKAVAQKAVAPSTAATTPPTAAPKQQAIDPLPLIVAGVLVLLFGAAITVMVLRRGVGRNEL